MILILFGALFFALSLSDELKFTNPECLENAVAIKGLFNPFTCTTSSEKLLQVTAFDLEEGEASFSFVSSENNEIVFQIKPDSYGTIKATIKVKDDMAEHSLPFEVFVFPRVLLFFPVAVALLVSFFSANVVLGALLGIFVALVVRNRYLPHEALFQVFSEVVAGKLAELETARLIVFVLFTNAIVYLLLENNLFHPLAAAVLKHSSSPRSTAIVAALLSLLVFFDDYASIMIVGSLVLPAAKVVGFSRHKLASVVHALSGPVSILIPLSSFTGVTAPAVQKFVTDSENAFQLLVLALPNQFYSIFSIFFVFLTVFWDRDFWFMHTYICRNKKFRKEESIATEETRATAVVDKTASSALPSVFAILVLCFFALAILCSFVVSGAKNLEEKATFETVMRAIDAQEALIWASSATLFLLLVFLLVYKVLDFQKAYNQTIEAFKEMLGTVLVLVVTGALGNAMRAIRAETFLSSLIANLGSAVNFVPAIVFVLASCTSFLLGSSWATVAMFGEMLGPTLQNSFSVKTAAIGAVFSGAILGDHLSLFSETTALAAKVCDVEMLEHFWGQLFYGLLVATTSLLAYLLVPWLRFYGSLIVGFVVLSATVFFCGESMFTNKGAAKLQKKRKGKK